MKSKDLIIDILTIIITRKLARRCKKRREFRCLRAFLRAPWLTLHVRSGEKGFALKSTVEVVSLYTQKGSQNLAGPIKFVTREFFSSAVHRRKTTTTTNPCLAQCLTAESPFVCARNQDLTVPRMRRGSARHRILARQALRRSVLVALLVGRWR